MKKALILAIALLPALALADNHESAEADVRDALMAFQKAYAENRVDDYFGFYADDASIYFSGSRITVAAYYDQWKGLIDGGGAVEKNDMSGVELRMLPGGESAVTSGFIDYRLRSADGEITTERAFESEVWEKIDGAWKIVNLHYSGIPAGP